MTTWRVQLDCWHLSWPTSDTQPCTVGTVRWCGTCGTSRAVYSVTVAK